MSDVADKDSKDPSAKKKNDDDDEKKMTTIVEGSATMCFPASEESAVFYNPVQVQNRDLSVLMISLYSERRRRRIQEKHRKKRQQQQQRADQEQQQADQPSEATRTTEEPTADDGMIILDALAASGLRSIRYWNEVPHVKHITINDMETAAVERAHTNIRLNKLQDSLIADNDTSIEVTRPPGIRIHHGDAMHELYLSRRPQQLKLINNVNSVIESRKNCQWDVIDLDPYGSAAPFLDAAVQAVEDGGLLCVTSTDMVALGGSNPATCYGRYASMPIPRAGYLHELSLRILLYTLASSAARYGRTIRPVLSVGMDFYVRVFCEVYKDKAGVNALSLNIGHVYQSTQCPSFRICPTGQLGGRSGKAYHPGRAPNEAKCEEMGAPYKIAGPVWLGPLHDKKVVAEALKRLKSEKDTKWLATSERLRGLLTSCHEELEDAPLYYLIPDLCSAVKSSAVPLMVFRAALLNAGYQVSGYHKEPQAIKTNAPSHVVWDVIRTWCRQNPPKRAPTGGAEKILSVEPSTKIQFTSSSLRRPNRGIVRFPENPQPHWGPKPKASGQKRKAEGTECDK